MTDAQPLVFTDNPLNPLEEALYEGLADASQMGRFERVMLEADLYAVPDPEGPGGAPGDDGTKVLRHGEQLILRGVVLNDGRNSVTLFTDPSRATKMFGEEARILAMRGRALLDILKDQVVLLNPEGGKGLLLNPDQIKAVLEHEEPPSLYPVSGRVELHDIEPENEPAMLTHLIREAFKVPMVETVWLARAIWPDIGRIGWFLDIRSDRPADEMKALAARAVRGLQFGVETLDVSVGKPGGKPGVGLKVV
ncbi:SseB family protein [Brevundimonas sp.]|uniref:SseB family protein n=1 Tax=Brevundimonas sp. TaxID=1871086 RepID=UPI002CC09EC2|nr:SseB family protein [Brevundimonas sp.]HWQ85354.1 SseB family protein [Brevundimonas sp.]